MHRCLQFTRIRASRQFSTSTKPRDTQNTYSCQSFAKMPCLPATKKNPVPRLPCKNGYKNGHQKAVLGSWGQLGRHIGFLGANSGAMVGVSGPTWVPAGAMLHLGSPTWGDAGLLATSWVPTWTTYRTPWDQLEGHVAKVPHLPATK